MNNKSTKTQPRNQTLDVLIIGAPSPQSEPLLRELRRAKYDPTPRYVDSLELVTQSLDEERFDVVLFDDSRTELSADEALRSLRASGLDIPCIIVAEEVDVETAVSLMRQGAGDCIARRDLHRLAPAIDRELKEAEARRQIARERKIAQERADETPATEKQSALQSSVETRPPSVHENGTGQSTANIKDAPASNNGKSPTLRSLPMKSHHSAEQSHQL
jgi:DNA-binding NtrC family response regulator